MIHYIYFVKCPNCDDEHFDFFDDAKAFALGCLGDKPIITQTEVCRNDFGECTDSHDLGTVWSWEELLPDDSLEAEPVKFSKETTLDCVDRGCYDADADPEFASLDNSLDSPLEELPDNFRKPVPADMTIEDLVEEMEKNEDTVECTSCNELFAKTDCQYEDSHGYLCERCRDALKKQEAFGRDPFDHHDPDYDEDKAADHMAALIDGAKDDQYDRALDNPFDIDYDW